MLQTRKKHKSIVNKLLLILIMISSTVLCCSVFNIFHLDEVLAGLFLPQDVKVGLFCIPDYQISVPLYEVNGGEAHSGELAQKYTDAANSAAYLTEWCPIPVIGDHNYQSFASLSSVSVGTISYITDIDGNRQAYQCIEMGDGINSGCILYDADGNPWNSWNDCDLATYTCKEDNYLEIILAKWRKCT